jgi:general secretion pathway protein A
VERLCAHAPVDVPRECTVPGTGVLHCGQIGRPSDCGRPLRGGNQVYTHYFGFTEKPFSLTPDPKYLFLSSRHQEALAHLEYGQRERGGFLVLTGEVGTGKTTVARHFLASLDSRTATAVVLYPALTVSELLRSILDDLGVSYPSEASLKALVDRLHEFLLRARAEGRDVVLLIDEAQDLSAEVLEQVRLISNLETDTEKLIQIVLMGQSELGAMLGRPDLRQLAQRITVRYHLTGLDRGECERYVRHRLAVAGGEGKIAFTPAAMDLVQRDSGGIPRLVNLICDRALLAGYVGATRTIGAEHVRRAAGEVLARPVSPPRRRVSALSVAAVGLLALAGGMALFAAWRPRSPLATPTHSAAPSPAAPSPDDSPANTLASAILTLDRSASYDAALRIIESLWDGQRLTLTPLDSHVDQLRRFDLPVVLELAHPARRDACFVALVGIDGSLADVRTARPGTLRTTVSEIERHWTRRAVFPWPQQVGVRPDGAPLGRAPWDEDALARLGYDTRDLESAVMQFQRQADLVADGALGPRTRLALFALSVTRRPRLGGERR